jgi:lysozyme
MKTSNTGIELIKKYEGCELEAYLCPAGVWTIGYGSTKGVSKGDTITQEEAEQILKNDIMHEAEVYVDNFVTAKLNQNQYDALVSFTFNLGGGALQKSTLLKKLNNGDYQGAANEFTRWVYAGGKKLNGLVKRRREEKELFLKEA